MYTVQKKDFMGVWIPVFAAQTGASAYHYLKGLQESHGKSLCRVVESF